MNSEGEGPAHRLAASSSPYLRQHAANPVDWWPWSEAAFAEAARRDVPVFLSVGYAACHWCHVMAHESFEDDAVAAALNAAFVCVKVDREERPDVDGIYMDACLAVHGHGGWPLTALLAPDRRPFYVATYLPPTSRAGRVGVTELAAGASRAWRDDRTGILASATDLTAALAADADGGARPPDTAAAAEALRQMADPEHGGFGRAPKFPTPHHALFLLAHARRTGDGQFTTLATDALRAIDRGGISDVLGGGIHRYATDRAWLLPHFEKMLTDQALFAVACTEAALTTGDGDLERAALGALAYVLRDLRLPPGHPNAGLFATSEDADSPGPDGHHHEGAFYLWSEADLLDVLGPGDAALARRAFGTTRDGTFVDEATGRRDGTNVLHRVDADALADPRFPAVCQTLFDARAGRSRPGLDDKALADGTGLTLAALAVAARAFARPDLETAMRETADTLLATFHRPDGGLWHRAPTASEPGVAGLLDDAAFTVWGLIETYQTTFETADLDAALALHADAERRFSGDGGTLFVSEAGAPDLIARRPSRHDGAVPAGASVHLWNALRLAALTEDDALGDAARARLGSAEHPTGQTMRLRAALQSDAPVTVVAGTRGAPDTEAMLDALRTIPGALVGLRDGPDARVGNPDQTMRGGRAVAYVCRHGACLEPTTDPARAATLARG